MKLIDLIAAIGGDPESDIKNPDMSPRKKMG